MVFIACVLLADLVYKAAFSRLLAGRGRTWHTNCNKLINLWIGETRDENEGFNRINDKDGASV
jgi:hypothetical protein